MSYGLTDEGFTAPRSADFLTLIRDAYIQRASLAMGTTIEVDWASDVFLGTITAIMADQLGGEGEALQAVYDAFTPGNAVGIQLDNLAMLVGVTRIPASYSTVVLACAGTNGTVVRKGALAQGGGPNGTTRWASTADYTITGGTVNATFQAEDAGAITADPGDVATLVTQIAGWETCTNAAAAAVGREREGDAALRKRRQTSLQTSGSRSLNAIRANLLEVSGVTAAVVVDNPTMATATVQGVSVAACGVAAIVYPDTLTDDQLEAVARVLYDNVAGGIAMSGAESATVTGGDGFAKTVRWGFATGLNTVAAFTVELEAGFELDDVEEPIQELITDWFLTFGVGDAARQLAALALAATVEGVRAAEVTFNAVDDDLVPLLTQVLVLTACTVVEA